MTTDSNQAVPPGETQSRIAEDSSALSQRATSEPKTHPSHPLKSFGVANFKAFGASEQTLRLRPITLVFGPNSSGKSSLLHFLLWMKDVVEGKGLDIYHPSAGGESVDLGGFRQTLHGINPDAELSSRLDFEVKDFSGKIHQLESLSVFASCQPPTDYEGRLKDLVEDCFHDVLSRTSWDSIIDKNRGYTVNLLILESEVVRTAIRKLLAGEVGEFTLERQLSDSPMNDLREANCPRLHRNRQVVIDDLLETPFLGEPALDNYSKDEILAELQALAGAVFKTLKYHPPPSPEGMPSLVRFELLADGNPVLRVERNEVRRLVLRSLDLPWLVAFYGRGRASLGEICGDAQLHDPVSGLVFDDASTWLPREIRTVHASEEASGADKSTRDRRILDMLEGKPEFPGLLRVCASAAREQFTALTYLGPLRAYPARALTVADLPQTKDPEGLFAWLLLYQDKALRDSVNEFLGNEKLTSRYEIAADNRVSLAATREHLAAELTRRIGGWCENAKSAREPDIKELKEKALEMDILGERDEDVLNYIESRICHVYRHVDDWDYAAVIRDTLDLVATQVTSESTGTVHLKDRRTGKQLTSRDIGVGVSQLLPVVVQAKAAQGELVAIEQPEIHLHPALQAELGDVFIESAMKQGNSFLIETHSEHLMLRIMRRIKETTRGKLPEGKHPIGPEDVCILYVEPTDAGSIVREMPVNERGELVKGWPGGFFEERLDELL